MHNIWTKAYSWQPESLPEVRLPDIASANVCKPDSKYYNAFIIYRLMEYLVTSLDLEGSLIRKFESSKPVLLPHSFSFILRRCCRCMLTQRSHLHTSSRWCKQALTTSQRLQMSFVEIGDEHILKLKIQKGTWSYLLSRWRWIALLFFFYQTT